MHLHQYYEKQNQASFSENLISDVLWLHIKCFIQKKTINTIKNNTAIPQIYVSSVMFISLEVQDNKAFA